MILNIYDNLPVLAMKMKDMQIGKCRGDAPLGLIVMK